MITAVECKHGQVRKVCQACMEIYELEQKIDAQSDALNAANEALNEVCAYGDCQCDIPHGVTCPVCLCAMAMRLIEKARNP